MSLKIQLNSLLTSSWNCVNIFTIGLRTVYMSGVAPLLRSAMMPDANWSASSSALCCDMPRCMFSITRARTMDPVVNPSIFSITQPAISDALSMLDCESP